MLRYAIVLEVCSSIITIGCLLYLLDRYVPRSNQVAHMVLSGALALATILFAHIPDLGRISIGSRAFEAQVPPLGDNALVVLGNQPMGLLAPLIAQTSPGASFIGIPTCFAQGQWCYTGFFHYGLGHRMREEIASHDGPIYAAYYANRMPIFAQLDSFDLKVDHHACQTMRTNRTPDVILCRAYRDQGLSTTPHPVQRFKLAVQTELSNPKFVLASNWITNKCSSSESHGKLSFTWQAPAGVKRVRVFVVAPPSPRRKPFTGGGSTGDAETGQWVDATQTFLFTDSSGKELARSTVRYVACDSN